ncbi:type II toxin-antitoxin system HicA family toxin [Desulfobacter sp.]|uniref:type II toxin-antitoxin system HicA family toxin n=1 Tax=Desulfobacter sp. TaxID=2294 RepID=UPI003D09BE1C
MKANPRDWRIDNLETIAGYYGLDIRKSGGSHVVFGHKQSNIVVTVPAHKPIKPVYIRQFILLVESVIRG